MNFTEYRRMRRNEEDEESKYSNISFTQIRKQRNPEKYIQQEQEKYRQQSEKRNEYIDNVNTYLQKSNMDIAGQAGKIQSNQYVSDNEMSDYVARREYENTQMRKKALELMGQAGNSDTVDYAASKQIRELLKNTVSRYNDADKANGGYAEYMTQFANQSALDRQLSAAKEKEAANAMTEEELEKSIEQLKEQSKQLKSRYGDTVKSPKRDREQILNIDRERKDIDSKIEEYKNLIYKKRQSSAIESLSDESKAAFDKYYGYMTDTPGAAETLATMTGFYDGYARRRKKSALKDEAKQALAGQGISEDEFDSLYEYYSFAKDEERNADNVEKWKADYNESGAVGKIAQNVGTALNTPIRGLAAAVEDITAKSYVNEYAPLNVNSVAYDMTNWTDTIRGAASENTNNGIANFLYQTGMSMADFGILAGLTAVTGGSSGKAAAKQAQSAVLGIMGTNAATSAAKEATLRGANKENALLTGLAAGTAEIAFEKIPLEHFFDILNKSGKAATQKAYVNILKQAGEEGLEEVFTDISNHFTDNLINGGMSEYYQSVQQYYQNGASMKEAKDAATADFAKQLGLSFAGGALSGGVMAGGGTAISYAIEKNTAKSDTKTKVQTQDNAVENIQSADLTQESALESTALNQSTEMEQNVQLESELESESEALEQQTSPGEVIGRLEETVRNDENFARTANISQREQVESIAATLENETIAKAMVSNYKDGIPVETYTTAFKNFLNAGYTDMSFNDVLKSNSYITSVIDEVTLKGIYYLGQNQAKLASQKYVSAEQKKLVNIVAGAVGVNVEFADMPGINGMYENGTVYISENATQPAMVVFAHELTHQLKENVSEAYSTYEDFVIDYMKEYHAKEYQQIRESLIKSYGTDEALIREEIAANASELFLTDEQAVNRFVKNNKTVAQRIAEFLNEFVEKLKTLYSDYKAKGKTAKIISEDMEIYERARDLWYAALEENVTDSVTNEEIEKRAYQPTAKENIQPVLNRGRLSDTRISQSDQESNRKFSKKEGIEEEIQEWFDRYSEEERLKSGGSFKLGTTSEVLKSIGLDDVDVYIDHSKIQRILDKHEEMDISQIKNIPNVLENPIMITSSLSQPKTSIVIFGDEVIDGKAMMLSLMINNGKGEVTDYVVTSAYGRNRAGLVQYLNNATYYYIEPDKKRTADWLSALRVQFPSATTKYGSVKRIPQNLLNGNRKFSKKEGIEDEIQEWFDRYSEDERLKSGGSFKLGTTSDVLKSIGLDDVDVYIDHSKIQRILDKHEEMDISQIKNIPNVLENPIMITSSLSQPKTSIVIFGDEVIDGKSMLLSLMINNGKGEVTDYVVTSAYGKNKFGVQNYLNNATYYYIEPDKKRTADWLSALRVQFPSATTKYGSVKRIPHNLLNGNRKFSKKQGIEEEIQEWFDRYSEEERRRSPGYFNIGKTTDVLKKLGLNDLDIYFGKAKIQKILNDHPEMDIEMIKKIPQILDEPLMICSSLSQNDSIVVFGNEIRDGKAIMLALKVNQGMGEVSEYYVTSAYGRTKPGVQNYLNNATYYYIEPDEKITKSWLKELRVQFPSSSTKLGYIKRIPQNLLNGNRKFSKKTLEDVGIRFSLKNDSMIDEELEQTADISVETEELLEHTGKILEEAVKSSGDLKRKKVSKDICKNMAEQYLRKYNAIYDKNLLADNLYNIFAYIQRAPEDINYEDMVRVMEEVCKPVIETSKLMDKATVEQYQRFSEYVKAKPIKLTKAQQNKIAQLYGSFEKFKEAYKGKYQFDDVNGVSLNALWLDLVEQSDSTLYTGTNYEDRMVELHRYMTFMDRSSRETADGMSTQQHSYDMALGIYTDYFKLINTDKGAYRNLEKQMRQELSEYKKKAADYYKQIYSRQVRKERLKKDNQIKALESQIRDLEFEMASDTDTMIDLNDEILKLKKNIESVKARNVEKIARIEAQNYDSYINRQRASKKTVVKNRIRRNMTDLQNRLAKPKENKYIPRELVRATVELCETVNIDTGKSKRMAERLTSLANLYERLKNDSDYALSSEYDEHTANAIKRLQSIFNGRNIMELELEELEQVDSVVSQLYFQITNAGKLIREGKAKDVYETAIHCMEEIEAADGYKDNIIGRGLNKYVSFSLNPETMFHRMSGYKDDSVLNEMYDELNTGEKKKMQVLMEVSKMFEPVVSGNHNQKAARNLVGLDKGDWIDLGLRYKNTEPVMVPKAFRVSLAMHIQNRANLDHIIYGGLTIPEPKAYQRGDYEEAYTRGTTFKFIPEYADTIEKRQAAYKEAERKLKGIVSEMTPYEREFMQYAEKFFHEYSGEKINEVSLKLNGYKKAVVNKYFPIRTDYNFNHSDFEGLVMNGTIEGIGMLKSRVGARNPIILEDITRVTQRQSDNVAKYYGLAIPVRNFNKVYNTTAKGYTQSTKQVIAQKWGKTGQKYVENLLTDLQAVRGSENTIADKLRGNFAASTLTMNLNVALSQLSAHPTGAYTTGWEACIYSLSKLNQKVDFELINKYTPLLWYRNQGNMTQEMADIKKYSWLNMLSEKSAEKLPGELGNIGKVPMAAVNMLQILDTKVIGNLWYACEYSVSKEQPSLKKGTDAYYEEVAKQFDKMIEVTQSNYTTMQRSEMLRSPNKATKQMFMFMTQPLQNFSILYDATMNMQTKSKQFKAGAVSEEVVQKSKEQFARAWSSQIAAAFAYAGLRVIGNVLLHNMNKYRDDEEEITAAQLLEGFAGDALGSLAGSAIAGNEIYSFFSSLITGERYYGLSVSTLEMLDDLLTDIVNLGNAQEITAEMLKNLVFDISNVTGQPIKNVWKIINGMGLHIEDAKNGEILSFNAGYEVTLSKQYNAMLNALADGDTNRYAEHEQKAMDKLLLTKDEAEAKKSVKSGIKSKLKAMYQSGDISYEQAKKILESSLEDDKAYFTLQSWDSAGDYNQYGALQKAVISGNGIEAAMKELKDNGIKSDTVESKLWTIIKEAYAGGQITQQQAVEYLKKYKDSEYTQDDTYWILRKWKSEDSEYTQNTDLIESVENGNFDSVVMEYLEHGYDASKIKSALSSKYRSEYIALYNAGKQSELLELKRKLGDVKVKGRRLYTQDDWLSWNKAAKEKK